MIDSVLDTDVCLNCLGQLV